MSSVTDFARTSIPSIDILRATESRRLVALEPTTSTPSAPLLPQQQQQQQQKPVRSNLQSQQTPSWIGLLPSSRPVTPGIPTMTQKARLSYTHAGLQPPVYIAGSFKESHWEPIEMQHTVQDDGELEFWTEFEAEQGEYQYKFRLGPGDWWVLDETKQIVDDGAGNRNNVFVVDPTEKSNNIGTDVVNQAAAPIHTSQQTEGKESHAFAPIPMTIRPLTGSPSHSNFDPKQASASEAHAIKGDERTEAVEAPAAKQGMSPSQKPEHPDSKLDGVPSTKAPAISAQNNLEEPEEEQAAWFGDVDPEEDQAPLFAYETNFAKSKDSRSSSIDGGLEDEPQHFFSDESVFLSSSGASRFGAQENDEYKDDELASPLFRHESLASLPSHAEDDQDGAPLFRHESFTPCPQSLSRSARSSSSSSHRSYTFDVDMDDIDDPSLERFPTNREHIFAQLQQAETRLPEDEVAVECASPCSTPASARGFAATASQPSPVMRELSDSFHLDCIKEDEEPTSGSPSDGTEELAKSRNDSGIVSVMNGRKSSNETKESIPKLSISPAHEPMDSGPLTPPMTPIEEGQTKGGLHDGAAEDQKDKHFLNPAETPRTRKDNSTDHIASRSTSSNSLPGSEDAKEARSKIISVWKWFTSLCGGRVSTMGVAMAVGAAAVFYAMTGRTT